MNVRQTEGWTVYAEKESHNEPWLALGKLVISMELSHLE